MPTIARFPNCSICMYAGDHLPPHFHVRMRDGRESLVDINQLHILRGTIPVRELKSALHWAASHQEALLNKWLELNP